jgi:hypothetical protein
MYGVELWSSMWHCTCDHVAEALYLATAVTSAFASAVASCCSECLVLVLCLLLFLLLLLVLTAVCGCPHNLLIIVLHPSGTWSAYPLLFARDFNSPWCR